MIYLIPRKVKYKFESPPCEEKHWLGFFCTRKENHDSKHEAHISSNRICARWKQKSKPQEG